MQADTTTLAPTDADLARLRFFRDLTGDERMKVLRVFGAIPLGAESEVTSHYIERRLFDRMLAKWGAPTPASGHVRTATQAATGMVVQALAGEIIAALLADEQDGGYDLTAGLFGAEFSRLVRRWAAAESTAQEARVPLSDEQVELLIEGSDGRWYDGEFRIEGSALSSLLRAANGITAAQKETP